MRAWVINCVSDRDREFLLFIGKLRGGSPKVSRRPKPIDWHYLDWLMDKPCAICGRSLAVEQIQIAACHVSRVAAGSGTGHKALWNAIPGCHGCHTKQHQVGESIVGGRRQWDSWADLYLVEYVTRTLLEQFGVDWEEQLRAPLKKVHPDFMYGEAVSI